MATVSKSKSINLSGRFTAGDLNKFLQDIPAEATIKMGTIPRDRPFDSATSVLAATWTEEQD